MKRATLNEQRRAYSLGVAYSQPKKKVKYVPTSLLTAPSQIIKESAVGPPLPTSDGGVSSRQAVFQGPQQELSSLSSYLPSSETLKSYVPTLPSMSDVGSVVSPYIPDVGSLSGMITDQVGKIRPSDWVNSLNFDSMDPIDYAPQSPPSPPPRRQPKNVDGAGIDYLLDEDETPVHNLPTIMLGEHNMGDFEPYEDEYGDIAPEIKKMKAKSEKTEATEVLWSEKKARKEFNDLSRMIYSTEVPRKIAKASDKKFKKLVEIMSSPPTSKGANEILAVQRYFIEQNNVYKTKYPIFSDVVGVVGTIHDKYNTSVVKPKRRIIKRQKIMT